MQENSHDIIGNLPELPNAENFKKVFKRYLIKLGTVYTILICLISILIAIVVVCITVPKWQFSQWLISLLMDTGARFDGKTISYGVFAIGTNVWSIIVAGVNVLGAAAFGVNVLGAAAFGLLTCGIISIGLNAGGVIAIGCNAGGVVAIGCNAGGIIAIGYNAFGVYTLSYSQGGRGKYLFAPHRQDAEAVAFFTRWFPKLSEID